MSAVVLVERLAKAGDSDSCWIGESFAARVVEVFVVLLGRVEEATDGEDLGQKEILVSNSSRILAPSALFGGERWKQEDCGL